MTVSEKRPWPTLQKIFVIAIDNVRTMAVDGKHGMDRAAEVVGVYQEVGCDIIGLHFFKLDM